MGCVGLVPPQKRHPTIHVSSDGFLEQAVVQQVVGLLGHRPICPVSRRSLTWGRCQSGYGCLGRDGFPTQSRGSARAEVVAAVDLEGSGWSGRVVDDAIGPTRFTAVPDENSELFSGVVLHDLQLLDNHVVEDVILRQQERPLVG